MSQQVPRHCAFLLDRQNENGRSVYMCLQADAGPDLCRLHAHCPCLSKAGSLPFSCFPPPPLQLLPTFVAQCHTDPVECTTQLLTIQHAHVLAPAVAAAATGMWAQMFPPPTSASPSLSNLQHKPVQLGWLASCCQLTITQQQQHL
jgi:hypothetical protein